MSSLIPLDKALGTLLGGTWASVSLWTIEAIQIWRYFSLFNHSDGWGLKSVILLSFASDTASTVLSCIMVYMYTIKHWGDLIYLLHQPIYFPLMILMIVISGAVSQTFLKVRIIRLTKSIPGKLAVGVCFGALHVALISLGLWIMSIFWNHRRYQERGLVYIPLIIWLSLSAAHDMGLAILLVILLIRLQSQNKLAKSSFMGPVIKRLLIRTVETGAVTAALVLILLALLVNDKESNAGTAVAICIGKVYTMTMITNLLSRRDSKPPGVIISCGPALSIGATSFPAPDPLPQIGGGIGRSKKSTRYHLQYSADIELNSAKDVSVPQPGAEFEVTLTPQAQV
ncbi:hypothetical protein T439DRAFT_225977 [Meredithblackwellia eburnea MCA 4105]